MRYSHRLNGVSRFKVRLLAHAIDMSELQQKIFEMAVMQAWNAIVITDADLACGCKVQIANPAFCAMTGYSLEELRGHSLKILQGPATDPAVIKYLRQCLETGEHFDGSTINYRKGGTPYVVRWNISPVRDDAGVISHFVSVQQDLTAFREAQQKVQLLAKALDVTSVPVVITDTQARIIFSNTAFASVTGYAVEELIGKTPALLRSGKHGPEFYQALRDALAAGKDFSATFVNRRRDGSLYHVEQSISPLYNGEGQVTHYVSVSKDVSDRVQREARLLHEASEDKLTALFNRRYGEKLFAEAHHRAVALGTELTVVVCDIDFFKQINDRFGHPAGDQVIKNVATILRKTVRNADAVIRWGGEEFLVILNDCDLKVGFDLAERIRTGVEAHPTEGVGTVTMSFGVASLAAGEGIEALFARADAALYEAKQTGRNRVCVSRTF